MSTTDHDADPGTDQRWLDDPRHVTWIVRGLIACGVLAFFADFFYTKNPHFDIERVFGFYALYGFGVSTALVLVAKQLRKVLMRPEDYYERDHDDE